MIRNNIEEAERKHLKAVTSFLEEVFSGFNLDSHGIEHHARVWSFARELLLLGAGKGDKPVSMLEEKLLIASMLHDSGMCIDPGPVHGIHSRKICEEYLLRAGINPGSYLDLLESIEHHDDKEYKNTHNRSSLDKILAISDDLDAFGITGIYRYLEIYIARGIDFKLLGKKINENAGSRFKNLLPEISEFKEFCQHHTERYRVLVEFFDRFNEMVPAFRHNSEFPQGECGVAEIIKRSLSEKKGCKAMADRFKGSPSDISSDSFFTKLKKELSETV